MRWKKKPKPQLWDRRLREGFLWMPCTINGETRWLERAAWWETYIRRRPNRWAATHWYRERWEELPFKKRSGWSQ